MKIVKMYQCEHCGMKYEMSYNIVKCKKCGLEICEHCKQVCAGCGKDFCPGCSEGDRCHDCLVPVADH